MNATDNERFSQNSAFLDASEDESFKAMENIFRNYKDARDLKRDAHAHARTSSSRQDEEMIVFDKHKHNHSELLPASILMPDFFSKNSPQTTSSCCSPHNTHTSQPPKFSSSSPPSLANTDGSSITSDIGEQRPPPPITDLIKTDVTRQDVSSLSLSGDSPVPAPTPTPTAAPDSTNDESVPKSKGVDPRSDLQEYYNEKGVSLLKKNKNFVSWHDNNKLHEPFWTSYFVAPCGKYFPAGRLIECDTTRYRKSGGLHWYGSKAEAIKAASGTAMDFFRFQNDNFNPNRNYSKPRHCAEQPKRQLEAQLPEDYPNAVCQVEDLVQKYLC